MLEKYIVGTFLGHRLTNRQSKYKMMVLVYQGTNLQLMLYESNSELLPQDYHHSQNKKQVEPEQLLPEEEEQSCGWK